MQGNTQLLGCQITLTASTPGTQSGIVGKKDIKPRLWNSSSIGLVHHSITFHHHQFWSIGMLVIMPICVRERLPCSKPPLPFSWKTISWLYIYLGFKSTTIWVLWICPQQKIPGHTSPIDSFIEFWVRVLASPVHFSWGSPIASRPDQDWKTSYH